MADNRLRLALAMDRLWAALDANDISRARAAVRELTAAFDAIEVDSLARVR